MFCAAAARLNSTAIIIIFVIIGLEPHLRLRHRFNREWSRTSEWNTGLKQNPARVDRNDGRERGRVGESDLRERRRRSEHRSVIQDAGQARVEEQIPVERDMERIRYLELRHESARQRGNETIAPIDLWKEERGTNRGRIDGQGIREDLRIEDRLTYRKDREYRNPAAVEDRRTGLQKRRRLQGKAPEWIDQRLGAVGVVARPEIPQRREIRGRAMRKKPGGIAEAYWIRHGVLIRTD